MATFTIGIIVCQSITFHCQLYDLSGNSYRQTCNLSIQFTSKNSFYLFENSTHLVSLRMNYESKL